MNLSVLWRLRKMRRRNLLTIIGLCFLLLGIWRNWDTGISHKYDPNLIVTDEQPKRQHRELPTRLNLSAWWPSLPAEFTDTNSCAHRMWNTFVTSLKKQYGTTARMATRDNITSQVRLHVHQMMKKFKNQKLCRSYVEAGYAHRPIIRAVLNNTSTYKDIVTFVTQLSYNRFDRLELVLGTWTGPVSASVYIPDNEVPGFLVKLCHNKHLANRTNVAIHLVLMHGEFYPMNLLRNVALNATRTVLSYLSDVDFIPSNGLVQTINALWEKDKMLFSSSVVVVPAFEMIDDNYRTPQNKSDIIQLWNDKKLIPAREQKWPKGHMPTNYHKWRKTSELYEVPFSEDYEPYIVMKTSIIPQYCERFVERYKDKSQQLLEVWAKGFDYTVLGSSYAVHYPHSRSKTSASGSLYRCAMRMNEVYQNNLKKEYYLSSIPQYVS